MPRINQEKKSEAVKAGHICKNQPYMPRPRIYKQSISSLKSKSLTLKAPTPQAQPISPQHSSYLQYTHNPHLLYKNHILP